MSHLPPLKAHNGLMILAVPNGQNQQMELSASSLVHIIVRSLTTAALRGREETGFGKNRVGSMGCTPSHKAQPPARAEGAGRLERAPWARSIWQPLGIDPPTAFALAENHLWLLKQAPPAG